ncbi:MAG: alpha/beta hydrolase, partial [Alphaproteobacteria bacterium]|nr:alpha/beta hydrolase [Alphaproteobacteria bacterium]
TDTTGEIITWGQAAPGKKWILRVQDDHGTAGAIRAEVAGGYVVGSRDSHDVPCRYLARDADCLVVSVDYRMAPEHPFPKPGEDVWAATGWIAENAASLGGDPGRIAIGGDSAGANLSTVTAIRTRDEGGPGLCFQLLYYPSTDMTCSFGSHRELGEGYRLTSDLIDYFMAHYFGAGGDRRDPRASPLFAEDLSGLPPVLLVTAGYDPLKDEGQAYTEKLQADGVEARLSRYPGMLHGFISMPGLLDAARQSLAEGAQALKTAFGK